MISFQGFFGAPQDVARQLFALPRSVVSGSYYALLLESDAGADVRVFVRADPADDHGEVRDWTGSKLGDLPERILRACWSTSANEREVAKVIDSFGPYAVRGGIMCPPSARGAFGHQLRRHDPQPVVRALVVS
ncbi:hypothetical protein ACFYOT_25810 [Saccharothrix saharensis]|uniref:hypothetical protein n=1 Tax=Saccharothrix saharensis TaxID=571190 RepID=UPI0036833E72